MLKIEDVAQHKRAHVPSTSNQRSVMEEVLRLPRGLEPRGDILSLGYEITRVESNTTNLKNDVVR
jgi:hypothetical protein